ncbi:unnamed protein product [Adineta steineri]|uniref:AIG1-type G domain-containing protein n=1 Tax=Adineta steineri TaxID=433720 RepID=A0A819CYG0_9BILA|nr:unnamed protein product [Adineta steineri]CAF3820037.1 unnamed protein product [Adineta steineri]
MASSANEMRIVLLGRTGNGKSSTGNSLLHSRSAFHSTQSGQSITRDCQIGRREYTDNNGQQKTLAVIDTPGFFDTDTTITNEDIKKKIESQIFNMTAPGVHAFCIITHVGRFTPEEKNTVNFIRHIFGQDAVKYCIVVFTGEDQLEEGQTLEDFVNTSPELRDLVQGCGNRTFAINNKLNNQPLITKTGRLIEIIDNMISNNNGIYYTNDEYQRIERERQEKQRKKEEEERQRKKAEDDALKARILEETQLEAKRRESEYKMTSGNNSSSEHTDLATSALNVHMYFQILYQGHYLSVYESQSNTDVKSGGTLKFFHVPLMFPSIHKTKKKWIWLDTSRTRLSVSFATTDKEIIALVTKHVERDKVKTGYQYSIAPMIMASVTAAIVNADGSVIPGIAPVRFPNPTHIALVFCFKCTSAEQGEATLNNILDGKDSIAMSIFFSGLHNVSMNVVKITSETLRRVASKTTADGGNTNAQFIQRKQANKFVNSYMANVEKLVYTEKSNAETQMILNDLQDQFKTLMQQAMETSAQQQVTADSFSQLWSSDDINPDHITNEINKVFKENKEETNYLDDSNIYFNVNETAAQSSKTACSADAEVGIKLCSGKMKVQASHEQQSSSASAETTHNIMKKQDIENYFTKEGIEVEWKGNKFVAKSFWVNKLTDITDQLQVALVAQQLIAEKTNGATMKRINVMDVPVPSETDSGE